MRGFLCILTGLISQALLQEALDEVTEAFSGWMMHYEVTSSPALDRLRKDQSTYATPSGFQYW
jgi:hypothetical protein